MYPEIKINAIRKGKHLYKVADELGWSASKLSQIIAGIHPATPDEKRMLADYFGCSVGKLFSSQMERAQCP